MTTSWKLGGFGAKNDILRTHISNLVNRMERSTDAKSRIRNKNECRYKHTHILLNTVRLYRWPMHLCLIMFPFIWIENEPACFGVSVRFRLIKHSSWRELSLVYWLIKKKKLTLSHFWAPPPRLSQPATWKTSRKAAKRNDMLTLVLALSYASSVITM